IALLSVFLVLGLIQFVLPKPQQPPQEKSQQQQSQQTPSATPLPAASATPGHNSAAHTAKVPVKTADKEAEYCLENGSYRISFSNRGADVKSWILTGRDKKGAYRYADSAGKPFDLVNQLIAPQLGYPLSLFTYDQN